MVVVSSEAIATPPEYAIDDGSHKPVETQPGKKALMDTSFDSLDDLHADHPQPVDYYIGKNAFKKTFFYI